MAPVSIRVTSNGNVVVLDRRGAASVVVAYLPTGQRGGQLVVPATIPAPTVATADAAGTFYFATPGTNRLWSLRGGVVKVIAWPCPVRGMTLKRVNGVESLYAVGETAAQGFTTYAVVSGRRTVTPLSRFPSSGGLSEPRVRGDGHLYAYAPGENLVYHYDPRGIFIETLGGGGPQPPVKTPAGGTISPNYDVADNGDCYVTMGDYGALVRLTADGRTSVRLDGTLADAKGLRWTGPFYTLAGLAVNGGYAYEVDRGLKRVTAFPLSATASNAANTDAADTRTYGLSYGIQSSTPYHLFTTAEAELRVVLPVGNRRVTDVSFDYVLRDFSGATVQEGTLEIPTPDHAAHAVPLPVLSLPKLGWYELDTTLRAGGDVLMEQANFLSRTLDLPALPIPTTPSTGWNDLATHRMIGMGLHRFGGSLADLLKLTASAAQARAMGIPYFLQLSNAADCTAENVAKLLKAFPDARLLEIVNEPNLALTAPNYVTILARCAVAARKINPAIQIMGPAQCGVELGWFESFLKSGGGTWADVYSVHTYERHNSMDVAHWSAKFTQLHQLLARYGQDGKALYQTEHGYLGDYHGPVLRHRWQARSLLLELMTLPRYGIPQSAFFYYYVNSGGYAGFSSYLVDDNRELYPAATMTRVRTGLLGRRGFAQALDFGPIGNNLLVGNRWSGEQGDVIELMNTGSLEEIRLGGAPLSAAAVVRDCFGNLVETGGGLAVGMYPLYVELPAGVTWAPTVAGYEGQSNLATQAKISVTGADGRPDAVAQAGIPLLTNGRMEFDFENEPIRFGLKASDGNLPLDVTCTFTQPRQITGAILYSALPDNMMTAPLAYEFQVHTGGDWQTVARVQVPMDDQIFQLGGVTKRVAWYDGPWIFPHQLAAPVQADAIRFHFLHTSNGHFSSPMMAASVSQAFGGNGSYIPEHVELRELQIFGE